MEFKFFANFSLEKASSTGSSVKGFLFYSYYYCLIKHSFAPSTNFLGST